MVFNKSASHVAGLKALRFHAKSTERFFVPSRGIGTGLRMTALRVWRDSELHESM